MAVSEYQLDKEAADINSTLNGSIVSNAAQSLSEAEQAQARANIGASAVGMGLHPIANYNTLAELVAAVPNPHAGDIYAVGEEPPRTIYSWDVLRQEWVSQGQLTAKDITARVVQNVIVQRSAWTTSAQPIFSEFPYKASITLSDVTENDMPIVVFSPADAMTGNYCPVAYSFNGHVDIFAKAVPSAAITLPSISFIVFGVESGSMEIDHRELTNREASGQHPISAITGLDIKLAGYQRRLDALKSLLEGIAYSVSDVSTDRPEGIVAYGAKAVCIKSIGGKSVSWQQTSPDYSGDYDRNSGRTKNVSFAINDGIIKDHVYYVRLKLSNVVADSNATPKIAAIEIKSREAGTDVSCGTLMQFSPTTWHNGVAYGLFVATKTAICTTTNMNADGCVKVYAYINSSCASGTAATISEPALVDTTLLYGKGNEPDDPGDFRVHQSVEDYLYSHPQYHQGMIVENSITRIESLDRYRESMGFCQLPTLLQAHILTNGYGWSAGSASNMLDFEKKKYIKKVKRVAVSDLTITHPDGYADGVFRTMNITDAKDTGAGSVGNILLRGFTADSANHVYQRSSERTIGYKTDTDKIVYFYDSRFTDAGNFKASLFGQYIYYEVDVPEEEDVSSYFPADENFNFLLVDGGSAASELKFNTVFPSPYSLSFAIRNSEATQWMN